MVETSHTALLADTFPYLRFCPASKMETIRDPTTQNVDRYATIMAADCEVWAFTLGTVRKVRSTVSITVDCERFCAQKAIIVSWIDDGVRRL
jgi:hypothetical protein